MPKSLTVIVAGVLLVAFVGLGAFYAMRPSAAREAPASKPAERAPAAPPASSATSKPRTGGGLSLDEAIKELDLIRPSRQKLADDFTVKMADGKSFRLSEHRGRPILINFWATWCPPCREEMPAMERLWRQYKDRGFIIVAITVDADSSLVNPFVREHGFTFPIGLDADMRVANTYKVRGLPSSFVIDRDGRLAALALGPRTWDNAASHSLIEELTR